MTRLLLVAALAACTASCSLLRPTLREVAERPWLALETEHARIWTDLAPEVAEQSARDFERHRRALLELWGPDVNPPGKMRVILLKSHDELALFGGERYGGMFAGSPAGPFLVLAADGGYLLGDSGAETSLQMHELAHAVTWFVLKNQPRWLAEGLATYLETTRIEADGQVALGKADVKSLTLVGQRGRVPLQALRAWRTDAGIGEAALAQYYASSWAAVHFFFNERPEPFLDYLRRLTAGEPEQSAWAASVGRESDDELERELSVHLKAGRGAVVRVALPAVPAEVTRSPAAPADVHLAFALVALATPGGSMREKIDRAWPEVKEALKLAPKNETAVALNDGFGQFANPRGVPVGETVIFKAASTAPDERCPGDIEKQDRIEGGSLRLSPGSWVAEFGKGAIQLVESKPEKVLQETVELAVGRVAMVLGGSASALVLREVPPGACVVNIWGTAGVGDIAVQALSSWASADKKVAVFLVGIRVTREESAPEDRWVVIATDGKRAWPALKSPAGIQLIARQAKLRPQKGKLFMDVKAKGPGSIVFAFRPEQGEFQRLN